MKWHRRAANKWLLKTEDGQILAVVLPYRSEFACKNQMKATVMGENRRRGGYWTTGIGVVAAKRNVERWLTSNSLD